MLQDRITQPIESANAVALTGSVHPQAKSEYDTGMVDNAKILQGMSINFKRSAAQEASLQALLAAQLDPSSPSYHQWLTPAQFGQQFGPADADIQTVTNWLQSHGFQITNVTAGRTVILASHSAAARGFSGRRLDIRDGRIAPARGAA